MNFYLFITGILFLIPTICGMEYKNNGGNKIPILGLGTFLATNETELTNALHGALEIGYRHIDTATRYQNEQIIGNVLKEWISSGKVKREDLFITTKLAPEDSVEDGLKTSLKKLQLDYVDLYLIHFPVALVHSNGKLVTGPTDIISTWKKMEEQVDAGRTKTIGLSNFNISQIERIQKTARIQPANLQVELHLYFQQKELSDFTNKHNITLVAHSPLGAPGLNEHYSSTHQKLIKLPDILHDETVTKIAKKYSKTNAQVALRYLIQSGIVAIPKSTNPKRMKQNIEIFDFSLTEDEMKLLQGLDKGKKSKIFSQSNLADNIIEHPEYPFYENL